MGLVDYSESESSGSESGPPPPAALSSSSRSKKPFRKLVDHSGGAKILLDLPPATADSLSTEPDDEPPAKRPRPAAAGLFSGLNDFLPAPKNVPSLGRSRAAPLLKTSATPGFSRGEVADDSPGASAAAQASIPQGQRPAEEVELVGKPLIFKPLSVARRSNNGSKGKKKIADLGASASATSVSKTLSSPSPGDSAKQESAPAPAATNRPLFSLHLDDEAGSQAEASRVTKYEPLLEPGYLPGNMAAEAALVAPSPAQAAGTTAAGQPASNETLASIADDLHLSAAARRELFGRDGGHQAAKKVINFNMDREYEHNESIRAAGDQQIHNPVRAIQGGKHSLKQLVQNVHNQREALEDSFAKGKSNRKEASSRYGW